MYQKLTYETIVHQKRLRWNLTMMVFQKNRSPFPGQTSVAYVFAYVFAVTSEVVVKLVVYYPENAR